MSAVYRIAPEVELVAGELIADVDAFSHLQGCPIRYVFRAEHTEQRGRAIYGKARRVSGLNAFLASGDNEPFAVIEIAEDVWNRMTDKQRVALVDHELSHLDYDGDKISLRGHDLEEFAGTIARHGPWSAGIQHFVSSAGEQLSLAAIAGTDPFTL